MPLWHGDRSNSPTYWARSWTDSSKRICATAAQQRQAHAAGAQDGDRDEDDALLEDTGALPSFDYHISH